jgi:hypothetical protein
MAAPVPVLKEYQHYPPADSDEQAKMGDVDGMDRVDVNVDALKSEIRRAIVNQKANAFVSLHLALSFANISFANLF